MTTPPLQRFELHIRLELLRESIAFATEFLQLQEALVGQLELAVMVQSQTELVAKVAEVCLVELVLSIPESITQREYDARLQAEGAVYPEWGTRVRVVGDDEADYLHLERDALTNVRELLGVLPGRGDAGAKQAPA